MRNPRILLPFIFATLFSFFPHRIQAAPDANNLLQTCKANTHINCTTHHIIYRSSTVIQKPGQGAVTMIQTTEFFKKKPNYLRMIMDDGVNKKDVVSNGDGYLYVRDLVSGKYQPIKAPIQIDPFQEMNNSLTDFDQATAQQVGDHNEITVRGGKMSKLLDHATLKVDPQMNVVTHMEGKDVKGNSIMTMDATYTKINNTYHPQHTHTEAHSGKYDVISDMDVTTNEVDKGIPDSIFAIK